MDGIEHIPVAGQLPAEIVANLRQLAEGLLKVEPKSFKMTTFTNVLGHDRGYSRPVSVKELNECGTCACAAGHAYAMGIGNLQCVSWLGYVSKNLTGESDLVFEWLFSGSWSDIDDTPEGAAKRILYMLSFGIPNDTCMSDRQIEIAVETCNLPEEFYSTEIYSKFTVDQLR